MGTTTAELAAGPTELNCLVLALQSQRELARRGYKRQEVCSQSEQVILQPIQLFSLSMPLPANKAAVKHELKLPDVVIEQCPMIKDILAAAQVL